MSLVIITTSPNTHQPIMIQEQKLHFTIYTGMPHHTSTLYPLDPRAASLEAHFFNGLTEDPHDDETDQEIDLDVEESDGEDEEWDEEDDTHQYLQQKPSESPDLLAKLSSFLAHLPTQPLSGSVVFPTGEPEEEEEQVTPPVEQLLVTTIPATSSCTHGSRPTTKKHRKRNKTPTKSSRKALPKNSY